MRSIVSWMSFVVIALLLSSCDSSQSPKERISSPPPENIFGNPTYRAISYGGYRGLTRDNAPTLEQVIEDMQILSAMGIKLLRTYNTSQYPLATLVLDAISTLKQRDPNFEMYVMLGAWIEARNAFHTRTRELRDVVAVHQALHEHVVGL